MGSTGRQNSGQGSELNPEALVGEHQELRTVSGGGDGGSDDDNDETIEFEIEIVSNSSSSKSGSLTDLRDEEFELEQREEESAGATEETPLIGLTSQPESAAQISDPLNPNTEPKATVSEARENGLVGAACEPTESADETELEFVIESIDDVGGQSMSSLPPAADFAATSIETHQADNSDGVIELEFSVAQQESSQEGPVNRPQVEGQVPEADETTDAAPEPSFEPNMGLEKEVGLSPETPDGIAQIENHDLKESDVESESQPSDEPAAGAESRGTESTIGIDQGAADAPMPVPVAAEKKNCTQMESVGSRNIREIYKVLNSDSILIVGCQPELVSEATTLENPDADELPGASGPQTMPDQPEVLVEQVSTVEVLDGAPDQSLQDSGEPLASPVTIEHPPELAIVPQARRRKSCSGDESEDLEWEFDHEPLFEKCNVKVKRGTDLRTEYELGDELGRGRFGTVLRCTHRQSGRKLAAKFVLTRRKEDREDVEREVDIMSCLQHRRLLQLYDAFDDGANEMCLVTELVEGGELFERIIDDDFDLTEKKAAIFMRQICEGVEYMHSQNIVHLDMKPENILCISRTGNRIKLIDFGLARQLDPNETLRVMFGTPDFAAPEVLCYDTVSLATDMWSVGVICYVLLSGLSPFMGNSDMETMANVTRATYDFDEAAFDPISDLAKDFIAKLLLKDQTKRSKPSECLKHAWLARGGRQLEVAVRERRKSLAVDGHLDQFAAISAVAAAAATADDDEDRVEEPEGLASTQTVSLDKRNLKKYVVRRKWHKTVHAIMALGRMGAKLKARFNV